MRRAATGAWTRDAVEPDERSEPFALGDLMEFADADGRWTLGIVTAILTTSSEAPSRRWRVMCRRADDGASVPRPLYCDGDGTGHFMRRAADALPGYAALGDGHGSDGKTATDVASDGDGRDACHSHVPPTGVSWLAALALGLAYGRGSTEECVDELVAASARDRRLLEAARAQLRERTVVDPDLNRRGLTLLAAAIDALRVLAGGRPHTE